MTNYSYEQNNVSRRASRFEKRFHQRGLLALLCFSFWCSGALAWDTNTVIVRGDYQNLLVVPPGTNAPADLASSAVFFNGTLCGSSTPASDPNCPTDGTHYLVQSAFGQMVSRDVPFPGFESDAIQRARQTAYYQEAEAANPGHGNEAAFAVLYLLYSGSSVTNVWARFDQVQQKYTQVHRDRVAQAQAFLRSALTYAPENENLRQELLDLYYNHALCEQMLAKELLVEVYQRRFDPPPPGGYILDKEIAAYPAIIHAYREAAKPYFELLSDPMGVSSQPPFGYTLFHEEVWQRSLQEPTMVLTNGSVPQFCYVLDAALLLS